MSKLYKVKIETDIMVMAGNEFDAVEIAKKNAQSEVGIYGKGIAHIIRSVSDIPDDWKSVIPYSQEGIQETRKCFEIVGGFYNEQKEQKELPQEDIEEIMKIKKNAKNISVSQPAIEIKPETRPDPKPKELDWHETKSGRPMPSLRFIK